MRKFVQNTAGPVHNFLVAMLRKRFEPWPRNEKLLSQLADPVALTTVSRSRTLSETGQYVEYLYCQLLTGSVEHFE